MGNRKQTNDLEKELVESGNWTRINEIVKEITHLYKSERNARAQRTNLLLGQKFLELRKLVTATDEEFNPKSAEGCRWGRFVKTYLKGCGVSRATTYRCAQAWKAASTILPEQVLSQLAEKEEMIGVAVSGEKPLGKFTLAMESAVETEPDFESEEGVEVFIETVLGSPEKAKKSDPMQALYLRVIKGLVTIAKSKLGEPMDGNKRELTSEMLRDPLYTLVSTVQRGIEMQGTHEYETANELPDAYGNWSEVITPKTTGNANSKAKPRVQEPKIPAAKKTKAAKVATKKKEEKKPIKHILNKKAGTTWCGAAGTQNTNLARQAKHGTCQFCIAGMNADVVVMNPKLSRRHIEKRLEDDRQTLARYEKLALEQPDSFYASSVPEYRESIAVLEQKLTTVKEIETPEQAVAVAKADDAKRKEAQETRDAIREVRSSLRQSDDSIAWYEEYKEALVAAKQPTWVVKEYDAAMREIEKEIHYINDAAQRKAELAAEAGKKIHALRAVGMKMHPAAEALAAVVVGSADCPTDEEVL